MHIGYCLKVYLIYCESDPPWAGTGERGGATEGRRRDKGRKEEEAHLRESTEMHQLKSEMGTSFVVRRLRIHLPVQGTQVRSLIWGDPTCRRATKPMCHTAELVL